jgi:hypothetical protein
MPDTSGHDATRRDDIHTITVKELEARIIQAGIVMSHRQILRHCKAGTFEAQKLPAANNIEEWFIAPASVDKGIADIKTLQALRSRRDTSRRDMSVADDVEEGPKIKSDMSSHDATRHDVPQTEVSHENIETQPVMSRHVAPEMDIYEHPYVKRLEERNEKLEAKYEAQVRRTEDIQMKSQQQIIELQRMTAIGQSQTLADFMLKAKEWILGQGSEVEKHEEGTATG